MSDPARVDAHLIDQICDRFEAEWRAGRRPAIDVYLAEVADVGRGDLLRELLGLEVEYRLRHGERPLLEEYQRRFPAHPDAVLTVFHRSMPAVARHATRPDESRLVLTATAGPHRGEAFTLEGHDVFILGRSRMAHLQIKDNYFSRVHFLIEVNPPLCRVLDLGSRNGTFLNGQQVQASELHNGDEIKAGHTALRVTLLTGARDAVVGEEQPTLNLPPAAPPAGAPANLTLETLVLSPQSPLAQATVLPSAPPGMTVPFPAPAPPTGTVAFHAAPAVSPAPPQQPAAGLPVIPGYRIERELGRGGMGVVYLAAREADGQRVALKMVVPAVAASQVQLQRFLREADILRQLQHPHIVAFREMGELGGAVFFTMDFVEGTDAARLIRDHGPLPARVAVRMITQVLSALEYAHAKKFVHRDIKPANLLVATEPGRKSVKVTDFGLARVYQDSRMSGLTMHGDIGGTVAFMPPEQITDFRQVKPTADQYSTAAALYTLLTGALLFDFQATAMPPIAVVLQQPPVPITQRRPDLPPDLAAVIHRALNKAPEARFPDTRDFRAALLPFVT